MLDLYLLKESFTNGSSNGFLTVVSLASILCGIFVIVSKNPIVSVLFLIGLFLSIAGYLMLLGINFIGLSYLLVYVGAVSILFLFILMLINVRISELTTDNSNSLPSAIMIGIFFYVTLYKSLQSDLTSSFNKYEDYNTEIEKDIYYHSDNTPMDTRDISVLGSANDISFVSSHI